MSDTEAFTMPDDDDFMVKSLDMRKRSDRELLRKSVTPPEKSHRQRWPGLDDEFKGDAVNALKAALKVAQARMNGLVEVGGELVPGSPRDVDSIVRTIAALEAQHQADEHLEDKNKRLDEGLSTENVVERIIKVEFDKRG